MLSAAMETATKSELSLNSLSMARRAWRAWCPPVRLELWNGIGNDNERRILREFEAVIPSYAVTSEVWDQSYELASLCRKAGKTVPVTDVLIAACARHHGVEIEHTDAHFDVLMSMR